MANSLKSSENYKKLHSQSQQTYYSTTQANFFKAYAHQIEFIGRLNELMNSIQKRKIVKVIEEVKLCNKSFRKYLNERRINFIKIEDVIAFEELYEKQSPSTNNLNNTCSSIQEFKRSHLPVIGLSTISKKQQTRLSNLGMSSKLFFNNQQKSSILSPQSKQLIKKGFMTFLEKLETLKKDQFTNQTKYLESILIRQCKKLKDYGFDDEDFGVIKKKERNYNAKMSVVQQIQKQQKINGLYPIIMKNIREETLAIQKVQKRYEILMKD